ncbi:Mss4-like protein [Xylariaceae sp. FL0255]|nr:Mss4-like protein [Xylariaceae sp. FL0255]
MSNPTLTGDPKSHSPTSFASGITGTCLCGAITVHIINDNLFTPGSRRGHLCHCSSCRKTSGSFAATNLLIETEKVEILDPEGVMKTYEDTGTLSGKPLKRSFCGRDGCPIKAESENFTGKTILKMGLFPRIPEPEMESFASHAHPWVSELEGTIKYKLARGGPVMGE